jgi:hypothetical protein
VERDGDLDPVWEDWFRHQRTWELVQKYTPKRRNAHAELVSACERSTDPEVRTALAKWQAMVETIQLLTGRQKERSEDE